ncbi:MAG: hypothetical protein JO149_05905 [Gammaproteobacteria bacterium]|nr:hypothetical protein [Gammaproteobacteria bacterium]
MDSSLQSRMTSLAYSHANFSFISMIIINTLFFSGYYILKGPLAFILTTQGISLRQAYSITTSANTLLALSSLFFGFILQNCSKQKFALLAGIFLSVLSIYLLSFKNKELNMFAITLYVMGGGLYFFNIVMFINKVFHDEQARIKGNYIYQIFVNLGGVLGCVLVLMQMNQENIFKYCFILGVLSLSLFISLYKNIDDPSKNKTNLSKFFLYLIILFFLIYAALNFASFLRYVVLFVFLTTVICLIIKAKIESSRALLLFVFLVILFNIPYWIANTIIFNQFFYFLMKNVTPMHGFSPASLIMIDPIVNAIFGSSLLFWQKNRIICHYNNLSYSSLLASAAFMVLCLGLISSAAKEKINFLYPLIALSFFACSEFLLQTTLNSRIRDLLHAQKNNEFLATGMMRSSRAFATVLGYYLILLSAPAANPNDAHTNLSLYCIMAVIFISSYLGFTYLNKTRWLKFI